VTREPTNSLGRGMNAIVEICRFFNLRARGALVCVRAVPCDYCAQQIRWWDRHVWAVKSERCLHRKCWDAQLFFKAHIEEMAEENQLAARPHSRPTDGSVNSELRELRASARMLRKRLERLEAKLPQAAPASPINPVANQAKQ
jgi:hypothetical protein